MAIKQFNEKKGKAMTLASSELLPTVQAYIINNMDFDGYELENAPRSNDEKLKAFYDIFISEYGYLSERKSLQYTLQEYLQGLPSVLTIKFYNGDIYSWLVEIGAATGEENDDRTHDLINNYWRVIAFKLSAMIRNCKLTNLKGK